MLSGIDKILMELTLQEENLPFDLRDDPEFCFIEENRLSLIGRVLNPDCQRVADLVLDMPWKWQLVDKVRRVVLSSEKFQFIFANEKDLEEIIHKGAYTFNQWGLVLERWVKNPPADFLQYIPVWVQLRNIPLNHKTIKSIRALGGFAGHVTEVAYPLRPQRNV